MSVYSFLAGLLTGVGVLGALLALWRLSGDRLKPALNHPIGLIATVLLATFALAAGVMYLTIGRTPARAAAPAQGAPHPVSAGDTDPAQSMETATAGLAARLAKDGGNDEQWELLAKSYDFLGRSEDARLAREHKVSASVMAAAPTLSAEESARRTELEQKLKSEPKDVPTLLELAALDEKEHAYEHARGRYEQVIALKGMTATSWADFADVLAAIAGGSLAGPPAEAIERALALDPRQEKALWLKASFALQEHRYTDALALWKTLRGILPAGSPEAAAIDANITEATQLAQGSPAPQEPAPPAGPTVSGTVSLDPALASQVAEGSALFIYARAAGQGGPPLAVMRLPVGKWPVHFTLDDSMAMMPQRRLSLFDQVTVEARISRSGQATPSPGDLYVTSEVIRPTAGKPLTLVINRKIS